MRRFLKAILTVAAMLVAATPLALAVLFHVRRWPDGAIAGLALVYVIWLPATAFALIWVFDRLGFHYGADIPRREPSPSERDRRRGRSGMKYLEATERSRREAEAETARRRRRQAEARAAQAARRRAAGEDPRSPQDKRGR